ncbi:MAG: cell division protein FtsL [Succinivibrionaceae bacterium]
MAIVNGSRSNSKKISLLKIISKDFHKYTVFFILLFFIILVSCALVYQVNVTRKTVTLLEKELSKQDELNMEYQHLRLEQQTFSENSRIENYAKEKLNMDIPKKTKEKIIIIKKMDDA